MAAVSDKLNSSTESTDPLDLTQLSVAFPADSPVLVMTKDRLGYSSEVVRGYFRNQPVAVKRFHMTKKQRKQATQQKHIWRELNALLRLRHDNIVPLWEVGYDEHKLPKYFVMELLETGSLQDLLDNVAAGLPRGNVLRYFGDLLSGLVFIHSLGFAHRDIKPGNLLISGADRLKICDLGLAKYLPPGQELTACGTPWYQAPEIRETKTYTNKVDIYSAGVVVIAMAKNGFTVSDLFEDCVRSHVFPVDADLAKITLECITEDPELRLDAATALERVQNISASDNEAKPGLNYIFTCLAKGCKGDKQRQYHTLGLGTFRPNEDKASEVVCCAFCKGKVEDFGLGLKACTAEVQYCIAGSKPATKHFDATRSEMDIDGAVLSGTKTTFTSFILTCTEPP